MGWSKAELIVLPIALLVIIILTILCRIFLKNKSNLVKSLPLQIIALSVVLLEITKLIRNIAKGFDTWALPFHYCSMFVFFFPLAQFGNEKIQKYLKPAAFNCALAMFVVFYFSPITIIGHSCENIFANFDDFHTFTFHHLIILYLFLSMALSNYSPTKKDYIYVCVCMLFYSVIGMSLAYMLNTNYCNFLEGTIEFLEILRKYTGQTVYTMFILTAVIGGPTILTFISYLVYAIKNNKGNVVDEHQLKI